MKKIIPILVLFLILGFSSVAQNLLYDEEFDDNTNDWPIDNTDEEDSWISNGYYTIHNKDSENDYRYWTKFPFDQKKNFILETRLRQVYGDNNLGYGLMFCSDGMDNNWNFEITSNGYYRISKKLDGEYDDADWQKTTATKSKGKFNVLKVKKMGTHLYFYINDQLVDTKTAEDFTGDLFGYIIRGLNKIQVDYLKIYAYSPEINIVDNPITQKKVNLGRSINTPYTEIAPVISPDGKTLYFVRDNYPGNMGDDKDNNDIWYSKNVKGKWTKAKNIGAPLNNGGHNFVIYATPDNNTLIVNGLYSAFGGMAGNGISITHKNANGTWSIPKEIKIDNFYNDDDYQNFAFTPDLQVMVMAIMRSDDTYGESDLYVSFRKPDGSYTEPKNMGSVINTEDEEGTPFIASDGKTLYFYSKGHGGYGSADIFVSKRLDDSWTNWSEPKNMGPGVNTADWDAYFTLDAKGEYAYLVSSANSFGEEDIYRIKLKEETQPEPVVLIYGNVYDKNTGKPLSAKINYNDLVANTDVGAAISNPKTGEYKIILPCGKNYGFYAKKTGYMAISDNIDLSDVKEYQEIKRDLYLVPIQKDEEIILNNIFFHRGKAELLPASYPELDRIVEQMKQNPKMRIEIQGHTNNIGDRQKLIDLSERRAKAVKQYLVDHGIDESRIETKGYGPDKPIADNSTAAGRQKNQRVSFIILNK